MRDHAISLAPLVLAVAFAPTAGASTPPVVVMNDNLAGCVEPSIVSYAIHRRRIRARLTLQAAAPGTQRPCTCRSGSYYFDVYPSDRALAPGTAVFTAPRPYRQTLGYAVLPHRPLPHSETVTFPLFRRRGLLYAFYHVVLGCPMSHGTRWAGMTA